MASYLVRSKTACLALKQGMSVVVDNVPGGRNPLPAEIIKAFTEQRGEEVGRVVRQQFGGCIHYFDIRLL